MPSSTTASADTMGKPKPQSVLDSLRNIGGETEGKEMPDFDPSKVNPVQLEQMLKMLATHDKMDLTSTELVPEPGYLVKTMAKVTLGGASQEQKVFLNICQSPHIKAPPPTTDEDLHKVMRTVLSEEERSRIGFRLPLSLSDLRDDVDRGKHTLP